MTLLVLAVLMGAMLWLGLVLGLAALLGRSVTFSGFIGWWLSTVL